MGVVVAGGVALLSGFVLLHLWAAASAGSRGRAALASAEANLASRDLDAARRDLTAATDSFEAVRPEIRALGPIAMITRRIPIMGTQVKAVVTLADLGMRLSLAGKDFVDVAGTIVDPRNEHLPMSEVMGSLRDTRRSLGPAIAAVSDASGEVARLNGMFLLGPLAGARDDLARKLPRIQARATAADRGLAALMAFSGDSEAKRYLFLSQNPDEVRPTGGFIGTYGLLTAEAGVMKLERYDDMNRWTFENPEAEVPVAQLGSPYRLHNPPLRRTIANVNTGPDWPTAAELASRLWMAGGEAPIDGVISFTPALLSRVLAVVGPVPVPSYAETATAENIIERLNFYTHRDFSDPTRKDFVGVVAEVVLRKLLGAPASQWEPLAEAMVEAFESREALMWSRDPVVAGVLAERGWDGPFPAHRGDFFFNSEFEYAAKNGRGIRRVYDHHVAVRPDGGARITTRLTLTNTDPPSRGINESTLAYLTVYGPEGAVIDEGASDPLGIEEPSLAGHPARGWFRAAAPGGGQTTLMVVWEVPGLLKKGGSGTWEYSLRWRNLPDHSGDVVNLSFDLPPSWKWSGDAPPVRFSLDREMIGSWRLTRGD